MRLTEAGLWFVILFLCVLVPDDLRTSQINVTALLQIRYDNALDNAVEDAMLHLVEKDNGREVTVNKEVAVERFFTGLFINMGIMEEPGLKNQMKAYIPVISIVERDGFWIYYHRGSEGMGFSPKYSFEREEGGYRIRYTLSDYVYITDKRTGETTEGDYHDVREKIPIEAFSERLFEETRRKTVINHITSRFSDYINAHNRIAEKYGIHYSFSLPVIEREDWYRTIDDISMVVFLQGYPFGGGRNGYYNRMALSGARVKKEDNPKLVKKLYIL